MDKENVVCLHTLEYYSKLKKREILQYAAAWMQLSDMMLSKLSQLQKGKYHMVPLLLSRKHRYRK